MWWRRKKKKTIVPFENEQMKVTISSASDTAKIRVSSESVEVNYGGEEDQWQPKAWLVVRGGSQEGARLPLFEGVGTDLGRLDPGKPRAGLDFIGFEDSSGGMSRRHCRIEYAADSERFEVVNCRPLNFTRVNGDSLGPDERRGLTAGDRIELPPAYVVEFQLAD